MPNGKLSLSRPVALVLQGSLFLLITGAFLLIAYLLLGKVYWFSRPFRGIALAFVLYVTGVVVALVTR